MSGQEHPPHHSRFLRSAGSRSELSRDIPSPPQTKTYHLLSNNLPFSLPKRYLESILAHPRLPRWCDIIHSERDKHPLAAQGITWIHSFISFTLSSRRRPGRGVWCVGSSAITCPAHCRLLIAGGCGVRGCCSAWDVVFCFGFSR